MDLDLYQNDMRDTAVFPIFPGTHTWKELALRDATPQPLRQLALFESRPYSTTTPNSNLAVEKKLKLRKSWQEPRAWGVNRGTSFDDRG